MEKYTSSFVNKIFENREADIVYKYKNKNIFFLIEHQTKIDYSMPYRILEYEIEIMKSAIDIKKVKNKSITKVSTKKYSSSISPLTFQVDGFSVFVGKNNKQNDYLSTKFAKKDDIWFHTKDIHGSHVILKTNGQTPPIEVLEKCASLAAHFSKAKLSSNVPVDYTFVKYVKKPSGSKPRNGNIYK